MATSKIVKVLSKTDNPNVVKLNTVSHMSANGASWISLGIARQRFKITYINKSGNVDVIDNFNLSGSQKVKDYIWEADSIIAFYTWTNYSDGTAFEIGYTYL